MNKFFSRKADIFPYIFIIIISFIVFLFPIDNLDELWNYRFARNIADGLIPYSEISMIQTPFSAYIASLFLLLFGKGVFAFRIAGFVLHIAIFTLFYHLCRSMVKNNTIAFTATIFIYALDSLFLLCRRHKRK